MTPCYGYHQITTAPRQWQAVAKALRHTRTQHLAAAGGSLYGIWRSQIGRPRDELTVMTVWPQSPATSTITGWVQDIAAIRHCEHTMLTPTLRPSEVQPPRRQGSYAFRWFETPLEHWQEFLDLCAAAWPGFEAAYDSQIIGLWRCLEDTHNPRRSLLLTRRPNLAMWERSKIPEGEQEAEVRRQLSRRYDLCDWTCVYTTTLLTAEDREDTVRWT